MLIATLLVFSCAMVLLIQKIKKSAVIIYSNVAFLRLIFVLILAVKKLPCPA
jgi:hypothetical protein